ncbi:MAG: glycoside hydrolase family 3 C-terminal domain-containing protein [Prevotella sp.]|nr:glycoside hydrolase family 3 C-terminal domain-containing protein [Prevotella sp.]
MKKIIAMLAFVPMLANAQAIKSDDAIETKVKSIVSQMTLDEKVGQMCQLCLDCVAPIADARAGWLGPDYCSDRFSLDEGRMANVFGTYKVGSILNIPNSIAARPQLWQETIRTLNRKSMDACNGVPQIHGVDMIHGASYTWGATLFPQEIGLGASFNRSISRRIGEITAYETRASLVPWVFAPTMDISRSPLWPRVWESFGEDVMVNAEMAKQLTLGLQGEDPNHLGMYNVAACLKHYLAYGAATSGKDRTPSSVSERDMMEKYFQPFKACIEAGALSIMVNSANNNGEPFHSNYTLLTEWLKDGLKWDGVIVTDWGDIDNLYARDFVAANKKEAICQAINAGIDMSMDPYDLNFCTLLKELVNEGKVKMSRIDDAVSRIVRMKIRLGLLDAKTWDIPYKKFQKLYPDFASDKFAQEARTMSQECMVLLKNKNNVLPIKEGKKIFVCGPNSNRYRPMNGGWTYTWQGDKTDSVANVIGKYHTFLQALENRFGKENVSHENIVNYDDAKGFEADVLNMSEQSFDNLVKKVSEADVIVAFIGENSYTETVGNTNSLELSANQKMMIDRIHAFAPNKPLVLVLNEGRPRLITEIEPYADAIVDAFLPSMYGGDALADLLSGDANFSGKMPMTYPKYSGSFATYDYKPCENRATIDGAYNYDAKMDILYPFGYGLSYTSFEYSDLTVSPNNPSADDVIEVSVKVKNTGKVAGKEAVLMYISDVIASLTPDVKRLRGFEKISLEPGEVKTVSFKVPMKDLAFVNNKLKWVLEPGTFRVAIDNQNTTFELK